jgi:hypothetical protein
LSHWLVAVTVAVFVCCPALAAAVADTQIINSCYPDRRRNVETTGRTGIGLTVLSVSVLETRK